MTAHPVNPHPARRPTNTPGSLGSLGAEMLTLQEACAYLRIPEGTLRYWRHLGTGPRSFKLGRHVRYWRADLILWLTEQTHRPQEER
jgi:excisionase family DNA binding protein